MTLFDDVFTAEAWSQALDTLGKLGIGALLGGAIGFEREKTGRPAGIRTHMLLVIGVVLIAEVSKHFGGLDSSRIAAQIVTGVGFLGAGTIMRTGVEVKGLTTAASLWAAAAIGFAVSTGGAFLIVAVAATILALFTLAVMDNIEAKLVPQGHLREISVKVQDKQKLADLVDRLDERGFKVESVRITATEPELDVRLALFGKKSRILRECLDAEGVSTAEFG